MANEQYANNAQTTLSGNINATVLTLTLSATTDFPVVPQFRILIDNELMLVTGVVANVYTVTRGIEGTAAAIHSDGATLTHILTAGALLNLVLPESNITGLVSELGSKAADTLVGHLAGVETFTGIKTFPAIAVSGITGAPQVARIVGATVSGHPTTGTFAVDDIVIDQSGKLFICSVAGTPGTWVQVGAGGTLATLTDVHIASPTDTQVLTFQTSDGKWHNVSVAPSLTNPMNTIGDIIYGSPGGLDVCPGHTTFEVGGAGGTSSTAINDGNDGTGWHEDWLTSSGIPYVGVDLGSPTRIESYRSLTGSSNTYTINLEATNDPTWATFTVIQAGVAIHDSGRVTLSTPQTFRYWRIRMMTWAGSNVSWVYSLSLYYGLVGDPARLAKGANNTYFGVDGSGDLAYSALTANEDQASVLINATSVGDAGNRSDHFLGSVLDAKWTGAATLGKSVAGIATGLISVPFTPSGHFRVEGRAVWPQGGSTANGLRISDAGGTNWVNIAASTYANVFQAYQVDASSGSNGPSITFGALPGFYYMAISRSGTTYTFEVSYDRTNWMTVGTLTKAWTVALLKLEGSSVNGSAQGWDFVDVVS